jgi:hypothetical protein
MEIEERRRYPRTKLDRLVYINLPSGNGGIVLDVSEEGLRFHAAAPMDAGDLIYFRLSVKPLDEIDVAGKPVWIDKTRKGGALRFIKLPDEIHKQIRIWLGQPLMSAGAGQLPPAAPEIRPDAQSSNHPIPSEVSPYLSAGRGVSASGRRPHDLSRPIPVTHAKIGWGTKLLLSLAFVALGVSWATLLFVHRSAQNYVQEEMATDARGSLLTAQAALLKNATTLSRKADLLATVVAMNPANDSTLQDPMDNPFVAEGSDLRILTDGSDQITALHASNPSVTAAAAEQLLLRSVQKGNASDWWYLDGSLYQVALQSVDRSPLTQNKSGTVVVGRQADNATLQDIGRIPGSYIALSYGEEVVASSLNTFGRNELRQKLREQQATEQIQIGEERFYSDSQDLTSSSGPVVRLTVLRSYESAATFLGRLNHLLVRLQQLGLLASLGFVILLAPRPRHRLRLLSQMFWRRTETGLLSISKWMRHGVEHMTWGIDRGLAARAMSNRGNGSKMETP